MYYDSITKTRRHKMTNIKIGSKEFKITKHKNKKAFIPANQEAFDFCEFVKAEKIVIWGVETYCLSFEKLPAFQAKLEKIA